MVFGGNISLGQIPRSRISGPNHNCVYTANCFEGNKISLFADKEIETPKKPSGLPKLCRAQVAKEGFA